MAIGKHIVEHAILGVDDTATLDSNYLKLDTSNSPITGTLLFNSGTDQGMVIYETGVASTTGNINNSPCLLTLNTVADENYYQLGYIRDDVGSIVNWQVPGNSLLFGHRDTENSQTGQNYLLYYSGFSCQGVGIWKAATNMLALGATDDSDIANNTEVMRIDSGNSRVGIGAAAPDEKLHIQDSVGSNGSVRFSVENTNAGGAASFVQRADTPATKYLTGGIHGSTYAGTLMGVNRADTAYTVSVGVPLVYGTYGSDTLTIGTNNISRLTIDGSTGAVAINGFTSAAVGLIVKGAASQSANLQEWQDSGGNVLSGVDQRGVLFSNGGIDSQSVYIGGSAGNASATGTNNVGIGLSSLSSIDEGAANTALGYYAGRDLTSGNNNVAIGASALYQATTSSNNVAIGKQTLEDTLEGSIYNIALGSYALRNLASSNADYNVALGGSSGNTLTSGSSNVFVGHQSGFSTNGSNNVFLGYQAGYSETGSNTLYIESSNSTTPLIYGEFDGTGDGVGIKIHSPATTAAILVVKGAASQSGNLTQWEDSSGNVLGAIQARGTLICDLNTDSSNLFIGKGAGNPNASGALNNVALGEAALDALTSGDGNMAIGRGSLGAVTTGGGNMAVGNNALETGNPSNSVAIGGSALGAGPTQCVGIGRGAGQATSGSENVFIGDQAGQSHSGDQFNVMIGAQAGKTSGTSTRSVFIGKNSAQSASGADKCTFIGYESGKVASGAQESVCIGYQSGLTMTNGSTNIFLGAYSGSTQTTNDNLLIVDNQARANAATELTHAIIYGVMGATPGVQTLSLNASVTATHDAPATQMLIVKAAASQSANLQEWQDSGGNVLAGADERGILFSDGGTDSTNLFIGSNAGNTSATGTQNFGVGNQALRDLTTGNQNVALGVSSLSNVEDGIRNIGIGAASLAALVSGDGNTAIGYSAGGNYTGSKSVFIGQNAGFRQTTNSNLLIIDNQQRADIATEATHAIIYGVMGANPEDQSLRINVDDLTIGTDADADVVLNFAANTNSGELKWMEDEDTFLFSDIVEVNTGTTGQSTIEAGLIVNNSSGNGAINDFQVNADTITAISVDASGDAMGFFGATPVVQQAYTAVSNPPTQAEVTAIRDALVNLGLMAAS